MKISDNLRQEDEPNIVYAICKLVGRNEFTKSEIFDLMTDKKDNQGIFVHNFRFAEDCGFIKVDNEKVECLIPQSELSSCEKFVTYIWNKVFKVENNFTKITRWFLNSNIDISKVAAEQLASKCYEVAVVDQNFIRGWHWWIQAFGLGTISSYLTKGGSRYIMYDCSIALERFIKSNYKKNDVVKAKQFFKDLCSKHAEFQGLIDFNAKDNKICDSLSLGLRLLHNTKLIELIYTPDSADIWHLVESFSHKIKFDITEIKIGDVE